MNESICWVNQKTLGLEFGVGPKVIGKWLVEANLRTAARTPTAQALADGYAKAFLTDKGIPYFNWNKTLTVEALRGAGHRPRNVAPKMAGPFRVQQGDDGRYEIVGTDGAFASIDGQVNAERICKFLDLAWRYNKLD